MLPPLSKLHFSSHTKAIHVSTAEKENQFSAAVENLRKLAKDEIVDIQVTCDGLGVATKRFTVLLLLFGPRARLLTQVLYCAECHAKRSGHFL